MGDGAGGEAPRYKAFISYSHRDAKVGRWLHRRLEGYRLPRRLVGRDGEHGPVPARLTPIFRDREELPAAGDLSEKVRAALDASENLVVVCSPDAAASPWVAKEIATFRELHPDRPVFAAIVEGEPGQCFPASLTAGGRIEPLAADLRPGRDGRRLGLLKLVAGLAGVGLDDFVQRDAQRRVRRVTYVTAAALAAMLAMAVLTAFAFSERREAERQRAGAEGLVEFMLTDLRERLKGVGRLDVMQAVNQRALSYYADASNQAGGPESLLRRARLLRLLGDDLAATGDLRGAAAAYEKARSITVAVLEGAPGDPRRRLEHARSENALGRVYEARHDWIRAEQQYRRFGESVGELVRETPDNADYLGEFAWSAIDLGNVRMKGFDDAAGAERAYRIGIDRFERALAANPGDVPLTQALANAHAWLADRYFLREEFERSSSERLRQYELLHQLALTHPSDRQVAFRFALAQRGLGRAYAKLGRAQDAAALEVAAYRSADALTAHDPRNADWLLFRAFSACDLLFGKERWPVALSRARLAAEVQSAGDALRGQGDPRGKDLSDCVKALNS